MKVRLASCTTHRRLQSMTFDKINRVINLLTIDKLQNTFSRIN